MILPTLVGALLLMHGLDVQVGRSHAALSGAAGVVHEHPAGEDGPEENEHCAECVAGHLLSVCLAVLTAVAAGWLLGRPGPGPVAVAAATPLARWAGRSLGPPGPGWIRLSVMRC